jgi:hypothetical protein
MAAGVPAPRGKPLPCAHHASRAEFRRVAPERGSSGLGTKDNPIIVQSADTPEARQRAADDALMRREEANNIGWVAVLAACLAGLGVVQFLALIAQGYWMARAARVADQSARAAKQTADAVVGQFRAYVSVNLAPTRAPVITQQAGPDVVLVARNSGQTPAFDATHWVMTGIGPAQNAPQFSAPHDMAQAKTTIASGSEIHIRPAPLGQLSEDEWGALHKGDAMIYVWGEIKYADAFRTARYTRFKYMFGPPNTISPGSLILCPDGNEAT